MKDGRTHLAYKAEHVVDLDSEIVLAAEIRPADHADSQTLVDSVMEAKINLEAAGSDVEIEEVAADKGYHANATLELASRSFACGRTFPSRKKQTIECGPISRKNSGERWSTIAAAWRGRRANSWVACGANGWSGVSPMSATRAGRGASWLRGLEEVTKRYRIGGRGAQSGPDHAVAVRHRQAAGAASPCRLCLACAAYRDPHLAMVGNRSAPLECCPRLPVHAGTTLTAGPPKAFPKRTAWPARTRKCGKPQNGRRPKGKTLASY